MNFRVRFASPDTSFRSSFFLSSFLQLGARVLIPSSSSVALLINSFALDHSTTRDLFFDKGLTGPLSPQLGDLKQAKYSDFGWLQLQWQYSTCIGKAFRAIFPVFLLHFLGILRCRASGRIDVCVDDKDTNYLN